MGVQTTVIPQQIDQLEDIGNVNVTPDDKEALAYDDTAKEWVQVPTIPIGATTDWFKSISGVPQTLADGWVECNGQTLSDADSPMNGQVIPNINGSNQFVRGNSTSGATGGASTMAHTHPLSTTFQANDGAGRYFVDFTTGAASNTNNLPPYIDAVKIMRVK